MKITDLKLNEDNPRLIYGERMEKLMRSIQDFPKMLELRPIVVDENNVIIGGNMRYRALVKLGYTNIDKKWVKKATDLTEEQKKEFVIKDNVSFGEWEMDILANDWEAETLEDWGFRSPAWGEVEDDDNTTNYTKKIDPPIYEPSGEKPVIDSLYDMDKSRALYAEIEGTDLSDEEKEFLKVATSRHIRFDYQMIANYYAHSDKEVQELMEKSALVIIDFGKAIENGYVEVSKRLSDLFDQDYEED
jgi:hypothetical protein